MSAYGGSAVGGKKTIIISLGGSLIVPEQIDINFLKKFKKVILSYIKKYNFVIFAGGGKIAREYQQAGKKINNLNKYEMDWLGIHASRLNALLLQYVFKGYANKDIITVPNKKIKFVKPIIIGAGWKPGWSTDFDAIKIAQVNKIKTVINLSNIICVYTKEPKKFRDAKKIEKINWPSFRKIVGNKWQPGLNMPFDPIASQLAQKAKIQVIIMGHDLNNFQNFIRNKKFKGTLII